MDRDAYVAANREAWDASAALHRDNPSWQALVEGFSRPDFSCLDPVETELLAQIGLAGKSVAQVCCNNARELLSVKALGAGRCTGFDKSAAFLDQGRELARISGHDAELVAGSAYDIPGAYDDAFDIGLITIGVFGWMPDLPVFLAAVARLLRPGGTLLVHEQHPVSNMFEPRNPRPLEVRYPYFTETPFAEQEAIVYDGSDRGHVATHYWFCHPLSAVVMAALGAGLRLELLREYPDNISSAEYDVYNPRNGINLPMSYALVARKG